MSRNKLLILILLAVVAASAAGWVAGSRIQSPAEAAARIAPPPASPILAPAEQRVLSTDIVTRGTARFGSPQQILVSPSALKPDIGIVTSLPFVGTEIVEGQVALLASGRPVFLLQGETPMYRDIGLGATGTDVAQVEVALARLGFDPGAIDGVYNDATATAVADWYTAAGFVPFGPTIDQLATIRALEADLSAAGVEALSGRGVVVAAEGDLSAAQAAVQTATAATANGEALVAAAVAEAESANRSASADLEDARVAVNASFVDYDDQASSEAAYAAANITFEVARSAVESTRLAGEAKIQEARTAAVTAEAELAAATAALRAARRSLGVAQQGAGMTPAAAATASQLEAARAALGIQIPADEVTFVRDAVVRVESLVVAPGEAAIGPVMLATDSVVRIDTSLPISEAGLVDLGMVAQIDEPDLGISTTGTVVRVAETPGTNGVDGFHVYVEILVEDPPVTLVGSSVRITIPIESTGGTVLAVPVSAVSLAADGSTRVQKSTGGALEFVTVEPGLAAIGLVEVAPITGTLTAGELVVVGFDLAGPDPAPTSESADPDPQPADAVTSGG